MNLLFRRNKYQTGLQLAGGGWGGGGYLHPGTVRWSYLLPIITDLPGTSLWQRQICGGLEQHHNTASSKQLWFEQEDWSGLQPRDASLASDHLGWDHTASDATCTSRGSFSSLARLISAAPIRGGKKTKRRKKERKTSCSSGVQRTPQNIFFFLNI